MSGRLVDPIHFFDGHGKAMLTRKHEEDRITQLEAENRRLKRLLKQTVTALKSERAKGGISQTAN